MLHTWCVTHLVSTLCMRTVPHKPLLPAFPGRSKAQSSATITMSTLTPWFRACSAASPKLRRSPV